MAYDMRDLVLNKLTGSSIIGWTFRIGDSLIGLKEDVRTPVPISGASTADTYTVGADDQLSLDPDQATAAFAEHRATADPSPVLEVDDRAEVVYADAVNFQGTVAEVTVDIQPGDTGGFDHHYTYTLRSAVADMMGKSPAPFRVPAESALTRLNRWFGVDVSELSDTELEILGTFQHDPLGYEEDGVTPAADLVTMTYLDIARMFTELTGVPLRVKPGFPPKWNELEVVPDAVSWAGVPPPVDVDSSDVSWINSMTVVNGYPTAITVTANDTRFLEGFRFITIEPVPIGQFIIGASRIGSSGQIDIGLGAASIVEVNGKRMAVARISHSFTHTKYTAALELSKPVDVSTQE